METIYLIIAVLLMLPGFVGIFFPVLPGIPYMLIVAFVYGLLTNFTPLEGKDFIFLGILALISLLIDYSAGLIGARIGGASRSSLLYGTIGMVLGFILLPPLGGFIGLFIGIAVAEWHRHRNQAKAVKAATAGVIGSGVGMLINTLIGIAFITAFIIFSLK